MHGNPHGKIRIESFAGSSRYLSRLCDSMLQKACKSPINSLYVYPIILLECSIPIINDAGAEGLVGEWKSKEGLR